MPAFPVLLVCEGNLCRSPFAERLLLLRLTELGAVDRFLVTSAGTRAPAGVAMDARSEAGLRSRGTDGDGFASRRLTTGAVDAAGVVLAATRDLRAQVLEESPGALHRAFTVRELAALAPPAPGGSAADVVAWCAAHRSLLDAGVDLDVPDPVRADQAVFDHVAELLDDACTTLARVLAATRG